MNIVTVFLLVITQASLRSCRTRHSVSLVHDPSSDIALVTPHKVPSLAQLIPILEGQDPPETKIRKLKKLIPIYDELNKWRIENNKRLVEILPFKKKVKPLAFILAGNDFVKVNKAEDNSLNDIHRKKLKSNKKHKRKPHTQKNKHTQENSFEVHHSNVEHKLNKYSESYSDSESESDSEDDSPESNEIEDGNSHVYQINLNPNKPNSDTHNELVHDPPSETVQKSDNEESLPRPYFASHSTSSKPNLTPKSDIVIQQIEPFPREADVASHKHTDINDSESKSYDISESNEDPGVLDSITDESSSGVETSKVDIIRFDENADSDVPITLHVKTKPESTHYNERESYLKEEPEKSISDEESNESISNVNRKVSVESEADSDESGDLISNEKSSEYSLLSDETIESNSDMNREDNEKSNQYVESNESKSASELNNNESESISEAESDDSKVTDENTNNSVFDADIESAAAVIESNNEFVFDDKSTIPDESFDYSSLYNKDFLKSKSNSYESLSDVSKSESISESIDSGSVFDTASVSKEESDVDSNEFSVSNEYSNEPLSSSGFIPNQIPNESILLPYADNDLEFAMEAIKSNEVYKSILNSNEYESVYVESGESLESKYDPELNINVHELYPKESEESIIEGHAKHIHVAPNENDGEHDVFVKGNHYYVADDSDFDDYTVDDMKHVVVTTDNSEFDDYNFDDQMVNNRRHKATFNDVASNLKHASKGSEHHTHKHVNDDKVDIKSDQSAESYDYDENFSINPDEHNIQVSRNKHITDSDGDNEETASKHLEKDNHHHHNHEKHHHHSDTESAPKSMVVQENREEITQIPRLILEHNKVPIVYDDDNVEENHEPIFRVELMKHHNNDDEIQKPKVQHLVAEYIDVETKLDSTSEVLEKDEDRVKIAPSRRVLVSKSNEIDDIVPNKHVVLLKEVSDTENDLNNVIIELNQAKENVIEKPTHYYIYNDIENNKHENNQPITKVNKAIDNMKDCHVMAAPKVKRKQRKTYKLSFIFN